MKGWRYEWVLALPPEIYDVIVEEMIKQNTAGEGEGALGELLEE